MKKIKDTITLLTIFGVTGLLASNASYGACTINALVKKPNAKTIYVNNVAVSKKIRLALRTQCDIKVQVMSKAQHIELEKAAFQRKLDRINKR